MAGERTEKTGPDARTREGDSARRHLGAAAAVVDSQRESLVAFARRLAGDDLSDGMSGNLSVRAGDLVAITPSGVPYEDMGPADICLVPVGGAAVDRSGHRPSTETPLHLSVYRATGAEAIVHTHSPFAVAVSAVLDELPAVHYAMADLGGPVRVAPYARFGTPELAGNAVAGLSGRTAVILRNHGAVTHGATLAQAYARARTLEWLARVYWHARALGAPAVLDEQSLTEVRDAMRALHYGEAQPGR